MLESHIEGNIGFLRGVNDPPPAPPMDGWPYEPRQRNPMGLLFGFIIHHKEL